MSEETDDFAFGSARFAKLYGDRLADSSLLGCAVASRWAFLYMLSRADAQGRFRCASVQGLARAAAVSLPEAEAAVRELEAPDPSSTSPEEDGRRIVRTPGGWRIVTYTKYRQYQSPAQRAEAERKRRQREAQRAEAGDDAGPSPQTPLPTTEDRGQKTDTSRDVRGRPGTCPSRGSTTARELAALETDPQVTEIGDAWVRAFKRPRRELGVLRAARTALGGGYAPDSVKLVVRVVAQAREAPERFADRGSIRWSVEHGKLDPALSRQ